MHNLCKCQKLCQILIGCGFNLATVSKRRGMKKIKKGESFLLIPGNENTLMLFKCSTIFRCTMGEQIQWRTINRGIAAQLHYALPSVEQNTSVAFLFIHIYFRRIIKAPDYLPNKEERGKKHLAEFSKQFCQLVAGRTDQCPLPLCCGIGCHVQCNIIYIWRRGLRSEIIK